MEKIGLIAGNRRFPLLFCREAAKKGVQVVAACIRGETDRSIEKLASRSFWLPLSGFSGMYELFRREGVTRVAMCGQISPARLFSREVRQSPQIQELLASVKDKRANSIFREIASRLQKNGFTLIDSTTFLEEHLPARAVLTHTRPSDVENESLAFAFRIAKSIAALDIGLSVAVKSMAVVAVEALEGTDNLILRSGRLCGRGFVVAKAGRPDQDMRFDIPVIGLGTVRALARAGCSGMGFESGKTLFLDKEEAVRLADKKGIFLAAL